MTQRMKTMYMIKKLGPSFDDINQEVKKTLQEIVNEIGYAIEEVIGIVRAGKNLELIIEVIEQVSKEVFRNARAYIERLPKELFEKSKELRKTRKIWKVKDIRALFEELSRLFYIIYLANGDEAAYYMSDYMYAMKLSLHKEAPESAPLYVLASLALIVSYPERSEDALALLGYGLRNVLPLRFYPEEKPWENPNKWAALFRLCHSHDIARRVRTELFVAWGIYDALKNLEEGELSESEEAVNTT